MHIYFCQEGQHQCDDHVCNIHPRSGVEKRWAVCAGGHEAELSQVNSICSSPGCGKTIYGHTHVVTPPMMWAGGIPALLKTS